MVDSTVETPRATSGPQSSQLIQPWFRLLFLLGTTVLLVWAWRTGWPAPIIAVDLNQHRANVVVPAPQTASLIRQTFEPRHDGLTEVELLLARHDDTDSVGRFELRLLDEAGEIVASESLDSRSLIHNQSYSLHFPAQPNSAGQQYTLLIGGTPENNVSAWGYDLDTYAGGVLELAEGSTTARDLRIVTRYRLAPVAALSQLAGMIRANGQIMLLAVAFMLMPGCLLLLAGERSTRGWDPAAWLGVALATGIATWPLLWLWLTVSGGRWTGRSLWVVLVGGWVLIIGMVLARRFWAPAGLVEELEARTKGQDAALFDLPLNSRLHRIVAGSARRQMRASRLSWHHAVLLLLLLLGLSVRLLAIRDLSFPPWVDSSRHALITAVMAESGQTIQDYEPLLPVERFLYHFGFHTLSSSLLQLTGASLPQLLLILGQLLNTLIVLTVYAGAYLLVRRRGVALLAAFLVALPFFFPAYYATWGRMTQLTAMVVMPVILGLTWRLVRGAKVWRYGWWLAGILAGGLFLIHFRLFLLFCVYASLVWLLSFGRRGRRLAMAAGLALLLVVPRIVDLAVDAQSTRLTWSSPGYNDFPVAYVTTGWEQAFLLLAAVAFILDAIAGFRRKRWALVPLFLAAWIGLTSLLLSGRQLGLPESWIINRNSAYISMFLPLALILAITADRVWSWLVRQNQLVSSATYALAGMAVAATLLFGINQQISILNSQTILAEPQDLSGLDWLKENTGSSDKIAVGSWRWLGNAWAGSDGGAWILPVARRATTTPPADYVFDRALAQEVREFNETASKVTEWSDPEAAEWLRQQGVSHVYVGARGGYFDPAALSRNPRLKQVYSQDGVFIFAVDVDVG